MLASPTLVIIEEIIESPEVLGLPALKKGQTIPAIEGFAPLILSLPESPNHLQDLSRREPLLSPLFEVLTL